LLVCALAGHGLPGKGILKVKYYTAYCF